MYTYPELNLTSLVIGGEAPAVDRSITVVSGSNVAGTVLRRGALLGLVTATNKYTLSVLAATDGSQAPKCVLTADLDTSAGDVVGPAYFEGSFADAAMTFGAGHNADTANAAFIASGTEIFIRKVGSFSNDVE